jgi:hypothetical protein
MARGLAMDKEEKKGFNPEGEHCVMFRYLLDGLANRGNVGIFRLNSLPTESPNASFSYLPPLFR